MILTKTPTTAVEIATNCNEYPALSLETLVGYGPVGHIFPKQNYKIVVISSNCLCRFAFLSVYFSRWPIQYCIFDYLAEQTSSELFPRGGSW